MASKPETTKPTWRDVVRLRRAKVREAQILIGASNEGKPTEVVEGNINEAWYILDRLLHDYLTEDETEPRVEPDGMKSEPHSQWKMNDAPTKQSNFGGYRQVVWRGEGMKYETVRITGDNPDVVQEVAKMIVGKADAAKLALPDAQSLWMWQINNGAFVAYDNPYPCKSIGGDPLVLGEPAATAIFKKSVDGRPSPPNSPQANRGCETDGKVFR